MASDAPLLKGPAAKPTLLCPASLPVSGEEWSRMDFRARCTAMHVQTSRENSQVPLLVVVLVYALFGAIWWLGFSQIFMDTQLALFTEKNFKRFIVYNCLHGLLGLGATVGLLGFRFKIPCGGPLFHFLTPGTFTMPLLPELVRRVKPVPAVRGRIDVAAYVLLLASFFPALLADEMSLSHLVPTYVLMVVLLVLDFSVLQCMRLEMYGYMLVCLCFDDWHGGCQVVMLGLWLWAGVSKCGPWWKYVVPFITKDNLFTALLPDAFLAKYFWTDGVDGGERYSTLSDTARCIAYLGIGAELGFPLLACCAVGSLLNAIGTGLMVGYHLFIASMLPFASVQEWNYFTILCVLYFFGTVGFAAPQSPLLVAFLTLVSFLVPLAGQIYPTAVPFLTAYRPYAGNWRFSWYICKRSALAKHKKLVAWGDPFTRHDLDWFYSWLPASIAQQGRDSSVVWDYMLTAYCLNMPNYRPVVPMIERLLAMHSLGPDDVVFSHSEPYQNQLFGWSLGTGYLVTRECTREAFLHTCDFAPGEMFVLNCEPMSGLPFLGQDAPFAYKVQCRLYDMTKGPHDAELHCSLPLEQLATFEPCGMPHTHLQQGGKSFKTNLADFGLDCYI